MTHFWEKEEKKAAGDIPRCLLLSLRGCETPLSVLPGCERVELLVVEEGVLPACQMANELGTSPPPEICEISLVTSSCSFFF